MQPAVSTDLDRLFSFTEGDTWTGIPSMIWEDGPSTNLVSVELQFRTVPLYPVVAHELSTADSSITITSAAPPWDIAFPPQDIPLKAGKWCASLRTTDDDGNVVTWWNINNNVWVPTTR